MNTDKVLAIMRSAKLISDSECPSPIPLTGGVSSDIWKIDTAKGPVCAKRALPRLKTRKTWYAPVERNANEAEWIRAVAKIIPISVPRILAEDRNAGIFIMEYFEPANYPIWKEKLRDGNASENFAAAVGSAVGTIHSATAGRRRIQERFATDHIFYKIRIEPYLLRVAEIHPDLARQLHALANITATTKLALVHGDVSPKNILAGPKGPVFLDAECAWYGDPSFDLAFCLNHLLLKCIWTPTAIDEFLKYFSALKNAYLAQVDWETAEDVEGRAAALLPGLLLARIDGASPVEYITDRHEQEQVRKAARLMLIEPPKTLVELSSRFKEEALS